MAKKPTKTADEEEGGEAKAAKKPPKKLIIMGAAGAVVLIGGGAGAYLMMSGGEPVNEAMAVAAVPEKPAFFFDLPVMIVNLAATEGRTTYVKLEVALELADQAMLQIVQPNLPRVLDAFQTYMRELRPNDLQGSAGLYRLKEELQRRINIAVYPARVDDVLFKNVIVQ